MTNGEYETRVALTHRPRRQVSVVIAATPEDDRNGTVLTTLGGKRWTPAGFRTEFHDARDLVVAMARALRDEAIDEKAIKYADHMLEIADRRFADLRGAGATKLHQAGCTIEEIAPITGPKRANESRTLDRHYLKNEGKLARAAAT